MDRSRKHFGTAGVELARCGSNQQEQQSNPLQVCQLPLEKEPKEDTCGRNLEVSKHLVGRRVHIFQEKELDVVLR